jgi:hypothetical protein
MRVLVRRDITLCGYIGALVVVFGATGVASAAPTRNTFVVARVPLGQTVQDLLKNRFSENVTCAQACKLSTSALIAPSVARKLGFNGVVSKQWVEVGTATASLKAKKLTSVSIHLNAQAQKLLAKVRNGLQVLGRTKAVATMQQSVRGSAGWIVTCPRR